MASYADNNRARFDYEVLTKYTAGRQLRGHEVKAIKTGKLNLTGSRVLVRGGEAYLIGAQLQPYQANNVPADFEKDRNLKLLLTKKEIAELAGVEHQRGLTIIPLSVYNKGGKIKIDIATARGKKKFDKRQTIKKREADRDIRRTLKSKF